MTKKEFYEIMEDFGAMASIPPKIHAMREILEMYPDLKGMTCENSLEWLENRHFEWYKKLQEKLGVGKDKDNLSEIVENFSQNVNDISDHIKMVVSEIKFKQED